MTVVLLRRAAAVGAVPALALALAACGGSTTSATQPSASSPVASSAASSSAAPTSAPPSMASMATMDVVTKLKAAIDKAKSVHLKGSGMSGGDKVTLDLAGAMDGSNGSYSMGMGELGFTVLVATNTYIKGNASFWGSQKVVDASRLVDKWVKMPDSMKSTVQGSTPVSVLSSMTKDMTADKLAAKAQRETLDGRDVFVIVDAKGVAEGVLYVDATTFLPLKYTQTKNDSAMTFTEWDSVAKAVDPPAAQIASI